METTNYKGVNYKTSQRKWVASLGWKGENISLGSWKTEIEAVRARDKVIIRMGLPAHKLQIFKKVIE